ISKPEGQSILHELVKKCDVVIENFRVGKLKEYRLSYDDLKAIKPDIIYASISGFGQTVHVFFSFFLSHFRCSCSLCSTFLQLLFIKKNFLLLLCCLFVCLFVLLFGGLQGPKKHEAGYDFAIQARGGLMSITG